MKNSQLNPYQIHWSIVVTNGLTKKLKTRLAKIGYTNLSYNGNAMCRHTADKEAAEKYQSNAIAILSGEKEGRAFIITDKQFGLGEVSYCGVVTTKASLPLIIVQDGGAIKSFPITIEQLKNHKSF